MLYIVATPIGNLSDFSPRGVETLRSVSRICAEDTRRMRGLLAHFQIAGKPIDRLDAHSTARDIERLIEKLREGESIALVTDAGTPAVSDPGEMLSRAAIAAGIRVVPIPGPSAILAALVGSGLAETAFRFVGFLPRQGPPRLAAIVDICSSADTVLLFEAANRTQATLREIAAATPDRPACVARELTKVHEEFVRGTASELAARDAEWMGEIVIVLGAYEPTNREVAIDDAAIDTRIDQELTAGAHAKGIAERIAAWSGRPKRELYERVIARKTSR